MVLLWNRCEKKIVWNIHSIATPRTHVCICHRPLPSAQVHIYPSANTQIHFCVSRPQKTVLSVQFSKLRFIHHLKAE